MHRRGACVTQIVSPHDLYAAEWRRLATVMDTGNPYEVLGLSNGVEASDDEILRAWFRVMALFHPENMAGSGMSVGEAARDPAYGVVQIALDSLSNVDRRRLFDSTLAFDDAIPAEKPKAGEDFFATFGPVFHRNARFSLVTPIPAFGGPEMPPSNVRVRSCHVVKCSPATTSPVFGTHAGVLRLLVQV